MNCGIVLESVQMAPSTLICETESWKDLKVKSCFHFLSVMWEAFVLRVLIWFMHCMHFAGSC